MKDFKRFTRVTAAALSAALVLAACQLQLPGTTQDTPAQTLVPRATRTALPTREVLPVFNVTASGVIALRGPVSQAGFDVTGKVTAVRASVGQRVKKGDVLAALDDQALRDAVEDAELSLALTDAQIRLSAAPIAQEDIDAAKASLASAQASYAQTRSGTASGDIETARRNVDAAWLSYLAAQTSRDVHCGGPLGTKTLDCKQKESSFGNAYESWLSAKAALEAATDPVSKNTLTQAYASVTSAQARLDALNAPSTAESKQIAQLQHDQAVAAVERAKSRLDKATLLSPCDCVVQEVKIAVGGQASAAAFTLVDTARANIQFQTTNLTERDLNGLGPGAVATIRLKAHEAPLTGKVTNVLAQSAGAQDGVALFTVLIELDTSETLLLPGMTGEAELALR
jgi:multidrug resistance efflux pump